MFRHIQKNVTNGAFPGTNGAFPPPREGHRRQKTRPPSYQLAKQEKATDRVRNRPKPVVNEKA